MIMMRCEMTIVCCTLDPKGAGEVQINGHETSTEREKKRTEIRKHQNPSQREHQQSSGCKQIAANSTAEHELSCSS